MNSEAISEFMTGKVTYKKHCGVEFRTACPHKLVVAKGLVDEVSVDEHDDGVQEAATR
jgi:hypothetical protein